MIDSNNVDLVPQDIPMKPKSQLYPASIYGDGNCLPRAASVLVYGREDKHAEMRKPIVVELTKNQEPYLSIHAIRPGLSGTVPDFDTLSRRPGNPEIMKLFRKFKK